MRSIRQYMAHISGGSEASESRAMLDEMQADGAAKIKDILEGKDMRVAVFTRDIHDRMQSCAYHKGSQVAIGAMRFAKMNKRFPGCLKWQDDYKRSKKTEELETVVSSRQEGVPGAPPRQLKKKSTIGKDKKEK